VSRSRQRVCTAAEVAARKRRAAVPGLFEFADINSFATTAPRLITLWGLTVNQIAYVTSLSFVGMFVGSLVSSWMADR
jgi:MFS family permease